jgi:excisionase family DNA binding protein
MVNGTKKGNENKALIESATAKAFEAFPTNKAVSVVELRTYLGISHAFFYDLLAKGALPASYKVGTRRLFDPNIVNAWLAERQNAA